MRSRYLLLLTLSLLLVTLETGCRPRANRSRTSRDQQARPATSQQAGAVSASQVLARTDSAIARIGAMQERTEEPFFASEPMLGMPPRTPWGSAYVPTPRSEEYDLFEAALAAYNGKDHDRSIGLLSQVVVSGRPPELIPAAYYWIGENYYSMARYQEMLPYFEYTVRVGPQPKRELSMYKLARGNYELGNKQAASLWYHRLIAEYPRTTFASRLRRLGVS